MGRNTVDRGQDVIAKGCQRALQLAAEPSQLAYVPCEQLGIAAAFLARALAQFDDRAAGGPRNGVGVRQIENAGKLIGAELRRRAFIPQ
jgi:hypothetical protein